MNSCIMITRKPKNTARDIFEVTNNVAGLLTPDLISDTIRKTLHQSISDTYFKQPKRESKGFIVM